MERQQDGVSTWHVPGDLASMPQRRITAHVIRGPGPRTGPVNAQRPGSVRIEPVTRVLMPLVMCAALMLSACSEAERVVSDATSDAASEAACSVARTAVGEVRGQVKGIASEIRADPQVAQRELTAVRGALAAAEKRLDGETREQIARARVAVDDLVVEARAVAGGAGINDRAVRTAQEDFDGAVDSLTELC
jgi:hypothetical protein